MASAAAAAEARLHRSAPPWLGAGRLALALALGSTGGWLFARLNLPLPWMLCAVCFTLVAALGGAPVVVPDAVRNGMLIVLGVLIGSGFSPEVLGQLHRWALSISLVLLYTVLLTFAGAAFFRRLAGFRPVDAFFAGLPGGLAAVVFIGADAGADLRRLSIVHSVRIVAVCFSIPFWVRYSEGLAGIVASRAGTTAAMDWPDALLLTACAGAGLYLARRARLSAPYLLGPMLLSATAHMTGLTAARPPSMLVVAAQVAIGSAIGCRFMGISLRRVLGTLGWGFAAALLMIGSAFAMAWLVHGATGLPYDAVLLALAPGGLPEMTLIALSLHIDLALVVSHHLVRVLFINVAVPVLFRLLYGAKAAAADPSG